ncbi:hypothetical protein OHA25_41930 [Nonomuraea sp. NBC_00507]
MHEAVAGLDGHRRPRGAASTPRGRVGTAVDAATDELMELRHDQIRAVAG